MTTQTTSSSDDQSSPSEPAAPDAAQATAEAPAGHETAHEAHESPDAAAAPASPEEPGGTGPEEGIHGRSDQPPTDSPAEPPAEPEPPAEAAAEAAAPAEPEPPTEVAAEAVAPPEAAPEAAAEAPVPLTMIERLQAELDATEAPEARALLLHEMGVLLERAGDDPGAARCFRDAFNAEPLYREPLEALVALFHRRRPVKNLGKLLEALVRSADTLDEASRAQIDRAVFLLEQQNDAAGARAVLRESVSENPDDLAGWLELEILAAKEGDRAARIEALTERASRAEPPTWRALLMLELAELEAQSGDRERAAATCRAAAALEGAARFRSQVVLAELGRREKDDALLAEALEAQAELAVASLQDPAIADADGIPRRARSVHFIVDVLLQASDARLRLGETSQAAALLERASEQLPGDLLVLYRQLLLADVLGSSEKGAALARKLLASVASGPDAASLWLRVYGEAKAKDDTSGEVTALEAAIKVDPTSVAVQALHMDALTTRQAEGDGALLAAALEAAAAQVESPGAKARFYLQAAWEWSSLAKDGPAARAALVRAGEQGVGSAVLARTARSLAALARDEAWYDEATEAVLASNPADAELSGLWLELVRGRLLRGDRPGAEKAIEGLVGAPGGEWSGRVLGAYILERGEGIRARTLDALAEVEPVPAVARALSIAAARRAQQAGDTSGIKARLEGLLRSDAADVVATTYLSERLRSEGDVEGAAGILQTATAASDDEALKAALSLESALLLWRAGKRERALEPLAAVKAWAPEAGASLLAWAQRGVGGPDSSTATRRQALELASEAGQEPAVTALERFGLELGAGQADEARVALELLENESQGALRLAAALARVIWPAVQTDRAQLDEALSLLATVGDSGAGLAAAERARLARDVDESKVDYARQAATWAELEPSLVTGLEWLSSAMAISDGEAEAGAHRLLASQLDGDGRAAEEAESLTVQWLTAGGLLPNLLPSSAPAAQLLNLELAPAGSDPRRRSGALKNVGGVLGEHGGVDARALAGWSDLAAGEGAVAMETFRKVVARRPDDIAAWEGLRTAALQMADTGTRAEATAKLGTLCRDHARGAAFLEEAGLLWLDQLNQPERGEQALAASFARDARRAVAFDKLFRRVRSRQEDDRLVELASRRLEVADDATEIVKLYWEQARILHKKADYPAALEALTNVTMFEPDHVGALVVLGDIHSKQGTFDEAAEAYAQLAAHKDAPAQQRLIAGVKAVDLYEKRLGKVQEALDVLVGLHKAGLTTLPVRERLATLAAKAGAWTEATSMLEALMAERETSESRIEAARLSMAIWRDKVNDSKGARRAVMRLLEESPTDGEALDLVLATDFPASMKSHTLGAGKTAIVQQLQRGALDADVVARLTRIARASDDAGLLQASLGALVALGRDDAASEQLADLEARTAKVPQIQIDARGLASIGDPLDTGPITRLFEVMGEIISEAMGPTKDALNVGRKERIDPRSGLALRNDIAAWAGALGLGEFELYVGGRDPNGVQGVGGEVPAIVVGAAVKSPLSASVRQAIAREIFALRRGITVVRSKDEAYVASIAVATCNLAEMHLEAPAFAVLGDVQRLLGKAMNRKVRKLLPEICQQVIASRPDVRGWARAAQRSLDRMAVIAAGDVSLVLADTLSTPRNELKRQIAGNERAERLLRFVLSPQYLELRNHLGMGVR